MKAPLPGRAQAGVALVVALLMLALLTLLVVSALRTTTTDLLVVNNAQERRRVEAAVQLALNRVISEPQAQAFVNGGNVLYEDLDPDVSVSEPSCVGAAPASGYSARQGIIVPEDTVWEMTGSATDGVSGAAATLTQGVRIRLHNGVCSANP